MVVAGHIQIGLTSFYLTPVLRSPSPLAMVMTNKQVFVLLRTLLFSVIFIASPVPFSFAQRVCAGFAQLGEMLRNR